MVADAHADLAALMRLAAFLRHLLNDRFASFASLNAPLSGALNLSRDQNRGEIHATPAEAGVSATPRVTADRPHRRRTAENDRRHAGVVGLADGVTRGADRPDYRIGPGACRQKPDWRAGHDL